MPTHTEIQETLKASQEKAVAYFQGLSPEKLERPCTANGVPGEKPWRPKDHLAHMTSNEQGIQFLISRTLEGKSVLPDNLGTMSAEERAAWGNQRNQTYVNAHYDDDLEKLFADLAAARAETLALLAQLTDEQLAIPFTMLGIQRTVGDMFIINAQHTTQHISWIEEGFRQGV